MEKKEEQQVLKEIYENIRQAIVVRRRGIAGIFEETLRSRLWESLAQWEGFAKRAKLRMDEKDPVPFIHQQRMETTENPFFKRQGRDETLLCPQLETQEEFWDQMFYKAEETSRQLKYSIHHWRHAGIYATELAKEILDFQEREEKILKNVVKKGKRET